MRRAGDRADRAVVRLGRHAWHQFVVVDQRDRRHLPADPGERPVVGTAAAAEPVAADVDGQGRDQHHVRAGHGARAANRLHRLQQAPRPGGERVRPLVGRPVKVAVGEQHRQDHVAAALPEREDEPVRVRFRADRVIGRHRPGGGHLRHFKHVVPDKAPRRRALRIRHGRAGRDEPAPQARLVDGRASALTCVGPAHVGYQRRACRARCSREVTTLDPWSIPAMPGRQQ